MSREPSNDVVESPEALAGIQLVALDVDGTLTDGSVIYAGAPGDASEGLGAPVREIQAFHVHDGQGLAWLAQAEVRVVWITGRGSEPTRRRADELGITALVARAGPKDRALEALQRELEVAPEHTAAMGDDLADLAMRARAAFFAAPADARPEVRAAADLVTSARGGHGAVRELCEAILRAKGRWAELAGPIRG